MRAVFSIAVAVAVAIAVALAVALVAALPTAHAHHVASDVGITPAKPRTIVELFGDTGQLAQGTARGTYLRSSPGLEVVFGRRFSLRGQLAFVHLERDGRGSAEGLGDTEVALKANLLAGEHGGLLVATGLGAKLPTGDHESGLGGGHYGLAPFVAASFERERSTVTLVAATMLIHQISLDEKAHGHALVLEPHRTQELTASATLAAVTREAWAALGPVSSWAADPADGLQWLSARLTVGSLLGENYRVMSSIEAPVSGDPGWRWRASLGIAYVQ